MKRFYKVAVMLLAVSLIVGCGDSATPTPVADQDELAKYAAENPSPPETPVEDP